MQRSETEAIITQIQPSKLEITNITNSQIQKEHMVNRMSSYFPKGGHSAIDFDSCRVRDTVLYHVVDKRFIPVIC